MPRYIDAAPYEDGRIVLNKEDAGVPVAEILTADVVERKKGRWIGKPIAGYCTVRCSACKNVFSENNGRWNFCPTCGADMRGGGGNVE